MKMELELPISMDDAKIKVLEETLKLYGYNVKEVSYHLKMSISGLRAMAKKYGVSLKQGVEGEA